MQKNTLKDIRALSVFILLGVTWYYFSFATSVMLAFFMAFLGVIYDDHGVIPTILVATVVLSISLFFGMSSVYLAMVVLGCIFILMVLTGIRFLINPEPGSGSVLTVAFVGVIIGGPTSVAMIYFGGVNLGWW